MSLYIEERFVQRTDNHPNKDFENGLADYITIHETANPDGGASAHASYLFRDGGAPYSWHVTVDDSTTESGQPMVYQSFPWSSQCWHAGDGASGPGNTTSIGIELCVNNDFETFTGRVMDTGAQLVAHLRMLGHGSLGVVTHQNWSGKNCPTRILENNLWDDFLKRVATLEADPTSANLELEELELSEDEAEYMRSGFPLVSTDPVPLPKPTKPNPPQPRTQVQSTNVPALIQGSRTLKKAAPEVAATGSTGGLLALLNSVGVDVDIEIVIGVMVAIPPLLFAARRLIRDAINTIKELKDSVS